MSALPQPLIFPVYTIGIIVRFPLRNNFDNLGLYLIQSLFIVLSPCAFIGMFSHVDMWLGFTLCSSNYLLYPRSTRLSTGRCRLFPHPRLPRRENVYLVRFYYLHDSG
jgi:hypothetical protein